MDRFFQTAFGYGHPKFLLRDAMPGVPAVAYFKQVEAAGFFNRHVPQPKVEPAKTVKDAVYNDSFFGNDDFLQHTAVPAKIAFYNIALEKSI